MVSLQEIQALEYKKKRIKKEIYNKIYEDFSKKIKYSVQIGLYDIVLKIPSFIFGYPSFDITNAQVYLMRQFRNGGFDVSSGVTDTIYVSWKKVKHVKEPVVRQVEETPEDIPNFVNLRKIANKLRTKP